MQQVTFLSVYNNYSNELGNYISRSDINILMLAFKSGKNSINYNFFDLFNDHNSQKRSPTQFRQLITHKYIGCFYKVMLFMII